MKKQDGSPESHVKFDPRYRYCWSHTHIPEEYEKVCCYWCCSVTKLCLTLCDPMDWGSPGSSVHGIIQARILEQVAISFSRGSSRPSIRVFSNESALRIRWRKHWSFSFSISPSNEYSGLTSFRIDWFDLLAVQGTLKSLCQHHSLKASVLWCSVFFIVQLTSIYNYWKNHSFD